MLVSIVVSSRLVVVVVGVSCVVGFVVYISLLGMFEWVRLT